MILVIFIILISPLYCKSIAGMDENSEKIKERSINPLHELSKKQFANKG